MPVESFELLGGQAHIDRLHVVFELCRPPRADEPLRISVDNIFVFVLVFSELRIPAEHQRRVLRWGVAGALALSLVGFADPNEPGTAAPARAS